MQMERFLDMRYEGQSYEIIVPFEGDFLEGFHRLHERTYGYRNRDKLVEIVNLRLRARGTPGKPVFGRREFVSEVIPEDAIEGTRSIIIDSRRMEARLYDRHNLLCGNRIAGPAIIVEYSSTIVVPPFAGGFVDGYGNLIFDIQCADRSAGNERQSDPSGGF